VAIVTKVDKEVATEESAEREEVGGKLAPDSEAKREF
jgi:hypothetical protein